MIGSVLGGIVLGGNVRGWDCPRVEVSWVGLSWGELSVGGSVRVGLSGVEVSGHPIYVSMMQMTTRILSISCRKSRII